MDWWYDDFALNSWSHIKRVTSRIFILISFLFIPTSVLLSSKFHRVFSIYFFISFLIYVCIFVLIKEFLSAIFFNILFTHWYSQYLSTYIYFNSKLNKKCPKLERKISTWKVCFKLELKILNYNFFFFFLTSS